MIKIPFHRNEVFHYRTTVSSFFLVVNEPTIMFVRINRLLQVTDEMMIIK